MKIWSSLTLIEAITEQARALDLNNEEICDRLGISPSFFSRWKHGFRCAPDPRLKANRPFYDATALFLNEAMAQVIERVLFTR